MHAYGGDLGTAGQSTPSCKMRAYLHDEAYEVDCVVVSALTQGMSHKLSVSLPVATRKGLESSPLRVFLAPTRSSVRAGTVRYCALDPCSPRGHTCSSPFPTKMHEYSYNFSLQSSIATHLSLFSLFFPKNKKGVSREGGGVLVVHRHRNFDTHQPIPSPAQIPCPSPNL